MREPKNRNEFKVCYRAKRHGGSTFDETINHGPLRFTIGGDQRIPEFEEAVVGMKPSE